ncbi:hypothetical protein M9458_029814, partial [Cirrhinus mrigala]
HHRTELEGRDPPVSGECPAPIQKQPAGRSAPRAQPTHTPATEPSPRGATAQKITTEPEPSLSDQVQEATWPAMVDVPVGREGAEDSTAHSTAAEGEQCLDLGHFDIELDLIDFTENIYVERDLIDFYGNVFEDMPSLPPSYELSACLPGFPTHSLSVTSSYCLCCLSSTTVPTICAVGFPRVCQSPSASWLEVPPPGLHLGPLTQRLHPGSQLPRLHSRPSAVGRSLIPSALPWLVVVPPSPQDSTPAAPHRSVPPALLGSSLPPSSSTSVLCRYSSAPWAPPWPYGSSVSPRIIGSRAPPPSVGPLELSALPPPWLLPTIIAAAWVSPGSSCSESLLSPPWLLPPSDPPWTLFVVLLPGVRPLPEPPPTLT